MAKFYLAHPFSTRKEMRVWELHLETHFEVDILNPFYDLDRDDVKAIDEGTRSVYSEDAKAVVERDKAAISKCDAMIAYVDGSRSIGTFMEIGYAYDMGTPVHLICTSGEQAHYWLKYHSDRVYLSLQEFEDSL